MSQRNNVNKKSTNGSQASMVQQLQAKLAVAEARSLNPRTQPKRKRAKGGNSGGNRAQGSFNNPIGAAAAYSTGVSTAKPRITASSNTCNVKHKEFIGNVVGTVAFTQAFKLALNPGIAATFPWLSVMAQNWETYRFRRLRFYYLTRTGSNIPGSVILCPDYDAADSDPISEQVIDSYEDAREDAPWKNVECPLSVNAMHMMGPKKFIRLGSLSANQDIKTFDVGNMFVYTVDGTAVNWGKVWVEYDVDFYVPQLPSGGSSFTQIAGIAGNTAMTAALPLGTAPVITGNMQIAVGASGGNSNIIISNAIIGAEYFISIGSTGTVITADTSVLAFTGATSKTFYGAFSAAATSCASLQTFTCTASTMSMTVDAVATTITATDVVIGLMATAAW